MNVTRTRFVAAAAAGAIACGGAIATAAASHADPTASSTAAGTSTSQTASPTSTSTSAPSGTSTVSSHAHVTLTPLLTYVGSNQVKTGFRVVGAVFADAAGSAIDYTSDDTYIDGKPVDGGDGSELGPHATLRPIDVTYRDPNPITLSAGPHTMKIVFFYATSPTIRASVTVVKKFVLGSAPTHSATPTVEPPTPSPVTTQLGVTG